LRFALLVAFLAASLDIVFDAYRTETVESQERGFGAAVWVNGLQDRIISGRAGALVIADSGGVANDLSTFGRAHGDRTAIIVLSPEPGKVADAPKTMVKRSVRRLLSSFMRPHRSDFWL